MELKQKDLDRVRDRPSSNLADPQAGQVGYYYKINLRILTYRSEIVKRENHFKTVFNWTIINA